MLKKWQQPELAEAVVTTLQDVLVHQRPRWATLCGHQHQMEAWWRAEFLIALESWCWRWDLPEETWVLPEAKPRDYGVGTSRESIDLLVAPWDENSRCMRKEPRVWIEIKERATWWGDPWKALNGLEVDLAKWSDAEWQQNDFVVACQILLHDSEPISSCPAPEDWRRVLNELTRGFRPFLGTRSVCYPCYSPEKKSVIHRSASIDFFTIHDGKIACGDR
jgi:hypothetical protein